MFNFRNLRDAVLTQNILWQKHALQRMMEREITRDDVKKILLKGAIIEQYPDDKPVPSVLILGWIKDRPLHAVVAFDNKRIFVITVYEPDQNYFQSDFKTRKKV